MVAKRLRYTKIWKLEFRWLKIENFCFYFEALNNVIIFLHSNIWSVCQCQDFRNPARPPLISLQMNRHLPFVKLKHVFAKTRLLQLNYVLSLLPSDTFSCALLKSKMTQDCTFSDFLPSVSLSVRPWERSQQSHRCFAKRSLICRSCCVLFYGCF